MTELSKLLKGASNGALTELAELTGLSRTTFVPNEPHQSAYNEGIRSIGLKLLALTEHEVQEIVSSTYKKRNLIRRKST